MRQHKIDCTYKGWTRETIIEYGTFTSHHARVAVLNGKVWACIDELWLSGGQIYTQSSFEIADPWQKVVDSAVIALIILFFAGFILYIPLYQPPGS
jgi:hypothetical protein